MTCARIDSADGKHAAVCDEHQLNLVYKTRASARKAVDRHQHELTRMEAWNNATGWIRRDA